MDAPNANTLIDAGTASALTRLMASAGLIPSLEPVLMVPTFSNK
jgi:hypothetical protein